MNHYKSQLTAYIALIFDEMHSYKKFWLQTIIQPVINLALYFFVFGYVIGKHLPKMLNTTYAQFIVPGILMILIVSYAYANAAFSLFRRRFDHSINDLIIAPVNNNTILLAFTSTAFIKTALLTFVITLLLIVMSHMHVYSWWLMALITLLTCSLFTYIGMIVALICKDFQNLSIVQLVLTPLIYLGGVFYTISQLPQAIQTLTRFNPLYYIIEAFRFSMLGQASIHLSTALSVLILINIVLYIAVYSMLQKGVGLRS